MTNQTQMNRIDKQLILYKRYLKFCSIEAVGKLCIEIAKLEFRLELIRKMNSVEILKKVDWQYVTVQSKANKLNL